MRGRLSFWRPCPANCRLGPASYRFRPDGAPGKAKPVPHKTSAPGKAKTAPGEPEAALSDSWFKRRERAFPRWMPYLFDLLAAIPAAAGLVAGVAFFSGQSASLVTMAALMLTCIL